MVFSSIAVPANELTAFNNDGAAFLAQNLLADGIPVLGPTWTTSGDLNDPDVTDPLFPILGLSDYSFIYPSASTLTQATTYITVQIAASSFDTVILYFDPRGGTYTITVQIADNATFTTNLTSIASFTSINSVGRLIAQSLTNGPSNQRIQNAEFLRVQFTQTLGTQQSPFVHELVFGQRLQLSRPFDPPYDEEERGAIIREFVSPARYRAYATYAHGFQDTQAVFTFSGDDLLGLDDLATLRALRSQSKSGGRPVYGRFRTGQSWLIGSTGPFKLPLQGYVKRQWQCNFVEGAPFASRES